METEHRCQSCGMPIEESFKNLGTNVDGSQHPEYCKFCFQDGAFTLPGLTVEGMIDRSVEFMTKELNFSRAQASEMSRAVIPKLKRWNRNT